MVRQVIFLLSVLFFSIVASAEVRYFKFTKNKVMAYEHIIQNPQRETLILLPGVNRALSSSDRAVRSLLQEGWNLLIPSLPAHPLSLAGLEKLEVPYFVLNQQIRVQDFAKDIEVLVSGLGIDRAIPVTLSYSSAVGVYLDQRKFPHLIETVPLGRATEAEPEAAKNAELWETWFRLNPFMAPFWIRQFRDHAYASHWGKKVDANLASDVGFYGESPRVSDIKAGYVSIARAVEDFDFTKWDFKEDFRTRDFVFAGEENPARLQNQLIVLKKYLAEGRPVRVLVVKGVGHVMPTENPAVYGSVVSLLASQKPEARVQFAFVSTLENTKSLKWAGQEALSRWIEQHEQHPL